MNIVSGKSYVLGDHINTDHILVAEYMKYNPAIPAEYETLGSLAMSGLSGEYKPFIGENGKTLYPIIIGGENFGCGSSREHAVVALEASGVKLIIAQSFARIFFRNCLNTGKVMLLETVNKLSDVFTTDQDISVDLDEFVLLGNNNYQRYILSSLSPELLEIVEAGGIFNYGRKKGKL
ncbi:MAG: hypothetical protein ABFC94_09415 [Syntrophomonas sp.]